MWWMAGMAWAAPCEGEAVTVGGSAYVVRDEQDRGNGAYGTGQRSVELLDAVRCDGPRLIVAFGAGSPTHHLRLSAYASAEETAWLLGRVGAPIELSKPGLYQEHPPGGDIVQTEPFELRITPTPHWHDGFPPEPEATLLEATCATPSLAWRCFDLFRGDSLEADPPIELTRGTTMTVYRNDARNQHSWFVVHHAHRGRYALIRRQAARAVDGLPPVEGPGGHWTPFRVGMDPGHGLTRFGEDGRILTVWLGEEDEMVARSDEQGVWLVPFAPDAESRGTELPPGRRVPWSDVLPKASD